MIEPDEILIDSKNPMGFSREALEGVLETPVKPNNFLIFFGIIFLVLIIFSIRLFSISILKGEYFKTLSLKNHAQDELVIPKRGIIYDRNFEPLVNNVPRFSLVLEKEKTITEKERSFLAEKVSLVLKEEKDDIDGIFKEALADRNGELKNIVLLSNIDPEKALILRSVLEKEDGVDLLEQAGRNYIEGENFSHIIGYLGKPGREELKNKADYSYNDLIGKAGVEFLFEPWLRGNVGRIRKEFNARRNLVKERVLNQPQDGGNLVLTIDAGLQRKIKESLQNAILKRGAKSARLRNGQAMPAGGQGAAVALNPNNGEILGLVSIPSFDNNIFLKPSSKELKKILEDPSKSLFNRAISGEYPSGSVIKPLIASAALEEKIINPNFEIFDPGYISVPSVYDPSIVYTFKDWKYFGYVSMKRAIAESANVYFYTIGGGYQGFKGLGIDKIKKYLSRFGFGSALGIDLTGEKPGFLPDPDWKYSAKKEKWFIGDTYNVSIGQGDIRVTPLQLAASYAAIANDGKLFKPRIVKEIVDSNRNIIKEFKPEILKDSIVSSKNIEIVKDGMRETIVSGSASSLSVLPVEVAGKTGTAQFGKGKKHAWFGSFAPYKNPEIVLVVLIEEGEGGSVDAVPVAKEVLEWYFSNN